MTTSPFRPSGSLSRPSAGPILLAGVLLGWLALGVACKGKDGADPTDGGGSDGGADGGGTDGGGTGDGGVPCDVNVSATRPADGQTNWYWRDPLKITLDGATDDLGFTLTDSSGREIPLSVSASDGGLVQTLSPGAGMTGSETYTLAMDICGKSDAISFTTSAYGLPLQVDEAELVGRTWYFDLPGATFVQPVGVGALLSTFLTMPILVGVTDASVDSIDLLGAQGVRDASEAWVQDTDQLTWDFPPADFGEAPYFEVEAEVIVIGYNYGGKLYEIPVYGFTVQGTIAADASKVGGGRAFGQGDTRNMGPLLGAGDEPTALCDTLASIGLECEVCPDGVQSCMTLEVLFPEAPLLPDVTLVEVD